MRRRRPGALLAACTAGLLALSGCGFKGAYSLPLPGGAATGKTYTVTAYFPDVQDLTPQSAVRVNDVAVGDVDSITLDTNKADMTNGHYLKAKVKLKIKQSVVLPQNAVATLQQTTLLGEKFVALAPPTNQAPQGRLVNGDVVGSASDLPSVEEVFGLLSGVLNGSDLQDLQTINLEVSKALAGRETAVRGALTQLTTFVGGLNAQKQQIVRALDGLDRFSSALAKQDGTISTALNDLGPGLKVLADEHQQFADLLTDLSNFGKVANHVITASSSQTIIGLRDLQPILKHLAAAGTSLPRALEILITFPFPRDSSQASPGDYTNFAFSLDLGPLLCSAFAGLTPAQLLTQLGPVESQLVSLLTSGTDHCQKAGTVSSPVATPNVAKGQRSSASPTGGTPSPSSSPSGTPTPSPTSTGLARLLNGLLGGGS
jgi:phospholipid/cholesterol/gamma-HCH transport system substrate-binding protein